MKPPFQAKTGGKGIPMPCAMELTYGHEANTPTMHTPQPKAEKARNSLKRRKGILKI